MCGARPRGGVPQGDCCRLRGHETPHATLFVTDRSDEFLAMEWRDDGGSFDFFLVRGTEAEAVRQLQSPESRERQYFKLP